MYKEINDQAIVTQSCVDLANRSASIVTEYWNRKRNELYKCIVIF